MSDIYNLITVNDLVSLNEAGIKHSIGRSFSNTV